MLTMLKKWWYQEEPCTEKPALELAMTKLMVGMMTMDGVLHESQNGEIVRYLHGRFELSEEESKELIEQTLSEDTRAGNFSKIITFIEKNYSVEERIAMLAQLWNVAIVDGEIDFVEEQYINRLSALMGVSTENLNELKLEQEKNYTNLHRTEAP